MGKIFCLIGKSSCGKDTIFKALVEDADLHLKPVVPYTTRPIRHNERHGVEYYFIDEQQLARYHEAGTIIERRDYHTMNGTWSYCTIDDGQIDVKGPDDYVLIVTLEAYKNLQAYYGACVVPIYITVEDGVRLQRALQREQAQLAPNYDELCRRFLADSIDFENTKLQACGIMIQYHNENLNECLKDIKAMILESRKTAGC